MRQSDPAAEYVRQLREPGAYPDAPERVDIIETHISRVLLAGDTVYKIKKSVALDFVDQSTVAMRERLCRAEVALNRSLAGDVYLGIAPIVRARDGRYTVDGEPASGEVVDYAVKMRRLPAERSLERLLAAGLAPPDAAERLARRLIRFHEAAAVVANEREFAGAAAARAWWNREYSSAEGLIGAAGGAAAAVELRGFIEETLAGEAELLDQRLADGRVVEGHGDLRAEHVYLLEERDDPVIVDCVEFSEAFNFRYLDIGYDIAFLAMDLEALGHAALGDEFAGRYLAAANDETLGILQPLHRALRAFVRGKIESLRAEDSAQPNRIRARHRAAAAHFLDLAASYASRRRHPQVIAMCGPPASGKSTVGASLAGRIGAAYLSSDRLRKELAGINPRTRATAAIGSGLYSREATRRTFAELERRAHAHLAAGRTVVLDAMHGRVSDRTSARALATAHDVPFLIAELRLDDATARARIAGREHDPLRVSDAGADVYAVQRERFQPVRPEEGRHITLDATGNPGTLAMEIAAALRP